MMDCMEACKPQLLSKKSVFHYTIIQIPEYYSPPSQNWSEKLAYMG
jgi:hypothetical protein